LASYPFRIDDLNYPIPIGGKVGIVSVPSVWTIRAFIGGKDKILSIIKATLENGAIQGQYVDLLNRYLLGESWMAFSTDAYFQTAKEKGMPVAWQNIDYVWEGRRPLLVRKGARHPNAARLLAIYLASPQGAKFVLEESGASNSSYPGLSQDLVMQGKKQGMEIVLHEKMNKMMEFYESKENPEWLKEIELLFQTTKFR
jgi:ABC-type Fe3+ transport system substrate-binding protein